MRTHSTRNTFVISKRCISTISNISQTHTLPRHQLLNLSFLSPHINTCSIYHWKKRVGDAIYANDTLAEIQTPTSILDWKYSPHNNNSVFIDNNNNIYKDDNSHNNSDNKKENKCVYLAKILSKENINIYPGDENNSVCILVENEEDIVSFLPHYTIKSMSNMLPKSDLTMDIEIKWLLSEGDLIYCDKEIADVSVNGVYLKWIYNEKTQSFVAKKFDHSPTLLVTKHFNDINDFQNINMDIFGDTNKHAYRSFNVINDTLTNQKRHLKFQIESNGFNHHDYNNSNDFEEYNDTILGDISEDITMNDVKILAKATSNMGL